MYLEGLSYKLPFASDEDSTEGQSKSKCNW